MSTSATPPPPSGGFSLGETITRVGAAAGGLAVIGGVLALIDARSLTKTFAVALLILLGCNLWRVGIQVWRGKYLYWRPGRIPDDHRARQRRWLNWHVAADFLVTVLGIAGALALFAFPDAPLLSKLAGEALLGGALFGIAASEAGWVDEIPGLETGTELVKQTRIGEFVHERAKAEFVVVGEPSFPPAKQLYLFLIRVDRSGRTSATVVALTVAIGLVIPATEVCAHAGRAFSERFQSSPDNGTHEDVAKTPPHGPSDRTVQAPPGDGCFTHIDVGRGAPQPQRRDLNDLWNRPGDGYGWQEAGCPVGPPKPVEGQVGVWYQEGFCGDELRGLGVARLGREAGVLFQEAAAFGRRQVQAKRLVGAYRRLNVGNGDLSVVDVELDDGSVGSYVLIRSRKTLGPNRDGAGATACGVPSDIAAPYAVVSPGMLPLWRRLVEQRGWTWPERDPARGRGALRFVDEFSLRPVAHGRCAAKTDCSLSFAGETYETDHLAHAMATTPDDIVLLRSATSSLRD